MFVVGNGLIYSVFRVVLLLSVMIWLPGLARCPKWGHLKELHRSIKLCEHALLNGEPKTLSLGPLQEVNPWIPCIFTFEFL